ncbi:MAG: hypothetical protein HY881_11875 [Deltaproteobacteria bacterium]|nr:hypothetical protein [Deltaproteobacteria bacterium]
MKKLFLCAAGALMSLMSITAVNAGPNAAPANQIYDNLNQDEQITPPKVGISWREQVMKERTIMLRAAEMRNANMRNALMGKQEDIKGLSVDSYNDLIMQRNAGLKK